MLVPWKESCDKPGEYIKKQRHHFADKGSYSQSYGFSSSHVQLWELGHKEGLSTEEFMCLNCDAGEDSWESLGLQGDQTCQSWRKPILNIRWIFQWILIGRMQKFQYLAT